MKWIKANPLLAVIGLLIGIAIVTGFFALLERKEIRHENKLEETGRLSERGKANEEVLNSVENAQDAVDRPVAADVERMRRKYDRVGQNNQ